MKDKIKIYTDGSARGNPGPAGWGAVILLEQNNKLKVKSGKLKVIEIGGRSAHSTNNQMELTAPIEALKYLKKHKKSGSIEIHSDSKYVITGINEWIHNWLRNNWRNANKKPVLNKDLWLELHELNSALGPVWHYVEGHSGHEHNDRADVIATSFADGEPAI